MDDRALNKWIRELDVAGIPGDIVAHFIIGAAIGWVAFLIIGTTRRALILILIFALAKELFFDLYANLVQGMVFEPFKDIIVSVLGAVVVLIILRRPFK